LSRRPEEITLSEIMEAIDNTLEYSMPTLPCMSRHVRTQIAETMRSASHAAINSFRTKTVADLICGETSELRIDTLGMPVKTFSDAAAIAADGLLIQSGEAISIR
jgi:DNA-binding IscR family transcriptional regulator